MSKIVYDSIGWLGVVLILSAYIMLTFGFLTPQTALYHILNLVGSISIVVSSGMKFDFQPTVLNGVFSLVALIGILNILF